ncbi:hypothetical protein ABMY21_11840 [Vibrio vulnificus]|uniref:hypothetical protein n=1 Tax=Vibrio vulnificus TaxID=672 RepID=UPI004059DE53|nr:hypothetical protein [Vibrio parahaemolyticus]
MNSLVRMIHGSWQLGILRFHVFESEFGCRLQNKCDGINHKLGIKTVSIDLLDLGDDYRKTSQIMDIIRDSEQPMWVWFVNCEALKNTSLAGWLRSVLSTYYVEHVRVAFILDNEELYKEIFQKYDTPLYEFTALLKG